MNLLISKTAQLEMESMAVYHTRFTFNVFNKVKIMYAYIINTYMYEYIVYILTYNMSISCGK